MGKHFLPKNLAWEPLPGNLAWEPVPGNLAWELVPGNLGTLRNGILAAPTCSGTFTMAEDPKHTLLGKSSTLSYVKSMCTTK